MGVYVEYVCRNWRGWERNKNIERRDSIQSTSTMYYQYIVRISKKTTQHSSSSQASKQKN